MPELKPWPRAVRIARRSVTHLSALRSVRPGQLRTWQVTTGAAVVGLAVAAGSIAVAGPWDSSGQRTAERDWAAEREAEGGTDHGDGGGGTGLTGGTGRTGTGVPKAAPSAPSVLTALGAPTGGAPVPTGRALGDVLEPLLGGSLPAGTRRSAAVVDAVTGERLWGRDEGAALTPASTIKLATAAAALSAAGADHRITTRTVAEPDAKEVVLVGGGDPTLTARADAAGNASLRTLADETASALKSRGTTEVTVAYDTSLYAGPPTHPIGPNENIAPVSALMVDEGRLDDSSSGTAPRSTDPAGDAARKFAELLRDRGVRTKGEPVGAKASGRAEELGAVRSAPLSALVERMLTNSDNDIAEALARQTAVAVGEPASFEGGGKAVHRALDKLELPLGGARFADGSGLDRADRLTADLLTSLLSRAADPARPELRPVLTGLPVAGFTGTLRNRYADGPDAPGTGVVRAKTGTLTGVHTLAGTVVDADGRLLTFTFMSDGPSADPTTTQSTLDHLATTLANCGCR
ncbi:D-alanyl-D-alanine carboxypeptidase/D-alanyl-D-alanine-endopeptidase [Streptomyces sp. NPDC091292]|uniref:D-alanyl-D-alanine carboxypeptidase/D-alanyl-D-alanine endopeptidase n=1 Tax=Streptomyces sp. NPDC091292 TaxID=3365991 RepID=UPI0038114D1D